MIRKITFCCIILFLYESTTFLAFILTFTLDFTSSIFSYKDFPGRYTVESDLDYLYFCKCLYF